MKREEGEEVWLNADQDMKCFTIEHLMNRNEGNENQSAAVNIKDTALQSSKSWRCCNTLPLVT